MYSNRTEGANDRPYPLGRGRHKGQKPHLPIVEHRGVQDLSPEKHPHEDWALCNQRTSTWTLLDIHLHKERITTFDRFKFFRAMQQSGEALETFYSQLRELRSHAKLENPEEDLVKDLIISNLHSSNIQKELLSEVITPQ